MSASLVGSEMCIRDRTGCPGVAQTWPGGFQILPRCRPGVASTGPSSDRASPEFRPGRGLNCLGGL
eukprot:783452-Alexandrium_andersonii.AAC.1